MIQINSSDLEENGTIQYENLINSVLSTENHNHYAQNTSRTHNK